MTHIVSSTRGYSLLSVVGAGFVVAAPLATWLAVGAVTADLPLPLTLDTPSSDQVIDDVVSPVGGCGVPSTPPGPGELDLHALAQGAYVVPAFKDGHVIGVKLFAIKPASLFAQAGLENGDIVTRVNGIAISGPEGGLAAYRSASESRVVVVDFLRRGQRGTLTHSLPASE